MSESKRFTPGPWVIIPGGDEWSQGRIATIEPAPETMIEINYWTIAEVNNRRHESSANASLIASAPDLLEALDALVKINEDHNNSIQGVIGTPPGWNDSYLDAARKALAKARGQQ